MGDVQGLLGAIPQLQLAESRQGKHQLAEYLSIKPGLVLRRAGGDYMDGRNNLMKYVST